MIQGVTLPNSLVIGLCRTGIVVALASIALGAGRSPDDRVVRMDRTGDVHLVDEVVGHGGRSDVGSAVNDSQIARVDQRRVGSLEDRSERLVDRVHLQQDASPLLKQLGEGVGRRNRRDIARPEHEGRFADCRDSSGRGVPSGHIGSESFVMPGFIQAIRL